MGETIYSFCKNGKRIDRPQSEIVKQEPIATDEPVISRGAIVTLNGHKGKVLLVEGDIASVSWEDASISKVPIKDLTYEGRVEKLGKGGPGSGKHKEGDSVKIVGQVKNAGKKGVVSQVSPSGHEYGVHIGGKFAGYYHESDLDPVSAESGKR